MFTTEHTSLNKLQEEVPSPLQQSLPDPVCGSVASRPAFVEKLQRELVQFSRSSQQSLSLVLVSVDYGEPLRDIGSDVIRSRLLHAVTRQVRRTIRMGDFVARYSDTALAIVLPRVPMSGVLTMAERLRTEVGKISFSPVSIAFRLSLHVGVVTVHHQDSLEVVLAQSEQVLAAMRGQGRERVHTQPVIDLGIQLP